MNALPVVMVRNEGIFIRRVLQPLAGIFSKVLVADTGSTDNTVKEASGVAGVEVLTVGPQSASGLTAVRQMLSDEVQRRGYEWEFLVDGDELYCPQTLSFLRDVEIPHGRRAGFTTMVSVDQDEGGGLWEMDDRFSRLCIHPAGVRWRGNYPFEIPEVFDHPNGFWYADLPPEFRFHALHLHRLQRSYSDGEVMLREHKRFQFSMQERSVPRTIRLDMGLWGL